MDSKDKPQSPKAQDPLQPVVGPGTNAEDAAPALAWQKHREQHRRPVVNRVPQPAIPVTPKKQIKILFYRQSNILNK